MRGVAAFVLSMMSLSLPPVFAPAELPMNMLLFQVLVSPALVPIKVFPVPVA